MEKELADKIRAQLKDTHNLELALLNWLKSQNPSPIVAIIALTEVLGRLLQEIGKEDKILGIFNLEIAIKMIREIATKAPSNG